MPWVEKDNNPGGLKGMSFCPRASACGISPGLGSPGPLGRPGFIRCHSIPNVALVELDLVGLEERTVFLFKGFDPVMLALVADVSPHVFHLGLTHRERPESRLPEEPLELRPPLTKPVVRALLEMADDVAQCLGPREKKQGMRVVGLGVDFDRWTAQTFERAM
jgi:hypothetical protein